MLTQTHAQTPAPSHALSGALPEPILSSRSRGWNGIVVELQRFCDTDAVVQMRDHVLGVHIAGSVTMNSTRFRAKRGLLIGTVARRTAVAVLLVVAPCIALAQDAYPSRPIALIVPFPPGGVADIVARPFADALSRELKAPVVIENKAGAGGGIGMGFVAKAKPDGYTLLLALSSISILPEADKITGRAPLYQLDQFTPIARLTADPTVLAVRADSPWKTLAEFVADARKRPGAITLRLVGQLRHDARADGNVRAKRGDQAAACAVHRRRPRSRGAARRQRRGSGVGAIDGDPACEGRKGSSARVVGRQAARVAARGCDTIRSRIRCRIFPMVGAVRARRDPRAGDRQAARGQRARRRPIPRFVGALATVETPVQYLDAPEFRRFLGRRRENARRRGPTRGQARVMRCAEPTGSRRSNHKPRVADEKSPTGCPAGLTACIN